MKRLKTSITFEFYVNLSNQRVLLVEEIVATGMHLSMAKDFIFNFASKNSFCLPKRFYTLYPLKEVDCLRNFIEIIDENSKSYVEGGE